MLDRCTTSVRALPMRPMTTSTVPSAPALPVLADRTQPMPTELRAILEDFKALRAKLIETVLPETPPRWRTPHGGDPFIELETRKANRLLAEDRLVPDVASRLAVGLLARAHGLDVTRRALRGIWRT